MIRLTGGLFRGRVIHTPANADTRPTQARLRQALFNSLQAHTESAKVLDLFAGSGALGFEALSRGAKEVVFVEKSRTASALIQKNAQLLKVTEQVHIITGSVETALEKLKHFGPFDLVFADPPYEDGWEIKLLNQWPWDALLSDEGFLCLEWGSLKSQVSELPADVNSLEKIREKQYGDSVLTTYSKR
ncbi:MAG: 16S rRNA (guanine(966)-N(2))-methyltransferase RsmD [Bdellovibrionia bacterium]